jgi:hypothetical protein
MNPFTVALRGITHTNNAIILQYPRNNVEDGAENAFTEWIVLRTIHIQAFGLGQWDIP